MIGSVDRDTEMAAGYALASSTANGEAYQGQVRGEGGNDPSNDAPSQHDAPPQTTGGTTTVNPPGQAHAPDHPSSPSAGDPAMPTLPGLSGLDLPGVEAIPTLAGTDGVLQPVLNVANTAVMELHLELETVGHELGLPDAVHGLTNAGETIGLGLIGVTQHADGHTNLITDVLNAPAEILSGHLTETVEHLGADLSDTVHAVAGLKDALVFGNDPTNPVGDLIHTVGLDLQNLPLLTINGGNNANDGGLIGGVVGVLNPSTSGHLIDADAGPQQSSGGLVLDLLSHPEAGPHHTAEVNAIDTPPGTLQLLDLGLLTGSHGLLDVPSLSGAGTDGLVGNLLGQGVLNGAIASGNTSSPAVMAPTGGIDAIHDLVAAPLLTDHGILDTHGSHIL